MAEHVLCDEGNHHTNIINTYDTSDSGRFNDVEFTLSNGSKLRANKFILASQSEYFETMFYGSLKHGEKVPLKWCSKSSMEKVLAFLSVGKVDIGDLEIMELLELLEAARLMCLEVLHKFVESFVKRFINSPSASDGKMPPVQALMALDFALVKQFENVTPWLLQFIDINIKDFMKAKPEEIGVLSANGMIILLGFDGSAKRIDLLTFFVAWKETGQEPGIEIAQYVKLEELNAQELKIARASKLYPVAEITDNLERIVMDHEITIKEANAKVFNLDVMIKEKDALLTNKDQVIVQKEKAFQEEKSKLVEENNSKTQKLQQTILFKESLITDLDSDISVKDGRIAKLKGRISKLKCDACKNGLSCAKVKSCNDCNNCSKGRTCLTRIHGK